MTLKEPEDLRRELLALADAAPVLAPTAVPPATPPGPDEAGPVLVCLADVAPRAIEWLWEGRIPLRRITLLVGRPGEGKSFLMIDITARVTTATPWPDGSACPAGEVILISAEDDPADTIRPRLDAHHADCRRVHVLTTVRRIGEDGQRHDVLFSLEDTAALEAALHLHPDCKLIVIDPIGSFLGGAVDAHRDNEVRSVLVPVAMLAEKYGAAVLIVAHRRKSSAVNADDLALGSRAFTGIPRAVWHLSRDCNDRSRRLLLPGKTNLSREGDGLAFTIAGEPATVTWERGTLHMNADDALAGEAEAARPGPEPEARNAAAEWLRQVLAGGPVPSGDLQNPAPGTLRRMAKEADFRWATVRRAADALGVRREKNRVTHTWQWQLPVSRNLVAQDVAQVCFSEQLEPAGTAGEAAQTRREDHEDS